MDFQFRVPDGKTFKYHFDPETTIGMIKKKICEESNYDVFKIKLIHRCSLLTDDMKVQDISITPMEYIVIQPFSSIPTSINCKIGKLPELQPPKPLSPSEITEVLNNLDPKIQSHKDEIKTMLEMGFSLQDSIRGLTSTNFNVEAASESITNDCYDNEFADDFRRNERNMPQDDSGPSFLNSLLQSGLPFGLPPSLQLNNSGGNLFGLPPGLQSNNPTGNALGPQQGIQMNSPPMNAQPNPNHLQPFTNSGFQPAQQNFQNSHNQYFEYRILTQEQKMEVDSLAQEFSQIPFDIIIQFYVANDKNVNKTKEMLNAK